MSEDEDLSQEDQDDQDGQEGHQDDTAPKVDNAAVLAAVNRLEGLYGEIKGRMTAQDEQQLKAAATNIRNRIRQATEAGDMQAVEAALADLDKLNETIQTATTGTQAEPPDFVDFKSRNKWYGDDIGMTALAETAGQVAYNKGLRGAALYSAVEKAVREAFPHKFDNPNRRRPSAVEGTRGAERRTPGKGWNDLPSDAKAACERFQRKGTYPQGDEGRKAYAADYFAQFEGQFNAA